MNISKVLTALEQFAPLPLQEDYDNVGLQIGLTEEQEVTGALLCLDVTPDIVDEAASVGANLIVAHHPLLFRAPRTITNSDYVGRCCLQAIRQRVAIYAAHTNLDNARGGVNFRAAELLGLKDVEFLKPLNREDGGSGCVGMLPAPMNEEEFLQQVKQTFGLQYVRHNALTGLMINRVAFCGGSGSFLIEDAVCTGADVFITGEVGYHHWFEAEKKIRLIEAGHYETERHVIDLLHDILHTALPELPLYKTRLNTNPIIY